VRARLFCSTATHTMPGSPTLATWRARLPWPSGTALRSNACRVFASSRRTPPISTAFDRNAALFIVARVLKPGPIVVILTCPIEHEPDIRKGGLR